MKKFVAAVHMTRSYGFGHHSGWFWDPTWKANLHILWPVSGKQVEQYIKRNFGFKYEWVGDPAARCIEIWSKGVGAHLICLNSWKESPKHYGILAHEAFHATHQILKERGVRLTDDSDEAFTYLLESIVDRCLQIMMNEPR